VRHISPRLLIAALSLALIGLVLIVYWPASEFDFVRIDDPDYVWSNTLVRQGLTWSGVQWAFTTGHTGNWHPLTWLSHMLDCQVFGPSSAGSHHLVSVGIHSGNSVLLMVLLWMMTGAVWRSALVAAMFAVHPLHVESVAWVAERKDVLSTLFGFLAIIAYIRWAGNNPSATHAARSIQRWSAYAAMLACFGLSLLAKPMLVTLPCVLLLLDFWPLQRISGSQLRDLGQGTDRASTFGRGSHGSTRAADSHSFARLFIEKVPLFAMSAASSVMTYVVQSRVGAVASAERLPLESRIGNAVVSYARYIGKSIWPDDLVMQYPHPMTWPIGSVLGASVILVGISVLAVVCRRRNPWIIVGWLWFIGTLVPVIGLVQVGTQAMADRYTYFPQIGLLIMVVWSLNLLARVPIARWLIVVGSVATVAVLSVAARAQVMVWKDTQTLCEHAVAISPDNWLMHQLLGLWLLHQGDRLRAAGQFEIAARLNPQHPEISSNLGDLLALQGHAAQAIQAYQRALAAQPDRPGTLNNLAVILSTNADPHLRDGPAAVQAALRACELTNYTNTGFVFTLAATYAETGQFDDAVRVGERARDLALAANQQALAEEIEAKLQLFRAGKPSREFFVDQDDAK
jgi:cytochrome c-type biogenesis protein CcmH/NrfG